MDIQRFLDQPIPPLGTFDSDYDCGEAVECGEAVVDITDLHPRIKFDASYLKAGIPGALTRCYVRAGVYDRLCMALDMLPEEYSFLIYDTLRPLRVQKALFDDYYARLEKQYPDADAQQLEKLHEMGYEKDCYGNVILREYDLGDSKRLLSKKNAPALPGLSSSFSV